MLIHLFIYSKLILHLLQSDTILNTKNTVMNQTDKGHTLIELIELTSKGERERKSKQIKKLMLDSDKSSKGNKQDVSVSYCCVTNCSRM